MNDKPTLESLLEEFIDKRVSLGPATGTIHNDSICKQATKNSSTLRKKIEELYGDKEGLFEEYVDNQTTLLGRSMDICYIQGVKDGLRMAFLTDERGA